MEAKVLSLERQLERARAAEQASVEGLAQMKTKCVDLQLQLSAISGDARALQHELSKRNEKLEATQAEVRRLERQAKRSRAAEKFAVESLEQMKAKCANLQLQLSDG